MGHITNHTIVVTGTYGDFLHYAHQKASELFPWISPISPQAVNGSQSFFIPPDGSKEGWEESDKGDGLRKEFTDYLVTLAYEDGSSPLSWIEVTFGGDDDSPDIIKDSAQTGRDYNASHRP